MKVILSVDVAKSSGWCLSVDGAYHSSGECNPFGLGSAGVVTAALALSPKAQLVLEQPSHGSRATLVGLGAARGAWLAAWQTACETKTPRRVKSAFPATWRSQLFGDTSKMPLREKLHGQIVSGRKDVGPDEAAAICISSWATKKGL